MKKTEITPDPGFNVLWGQNAQGKTNILEGIYLLGNLKSFRRARNEELINSEAVLSRIGGEVLCKGTNHRIDLAIDAKGKVARLDKKEVKRASHFFGYLRPVIFSPEEVSLVKGYPVGRRNLLDRAIFQVDPGYLRKAQEYNRNLKQRNRLLKEGKDTEYLIPWTESFIKAGVSIRWERWNYLQRIVPLLKDAYQNITGGRERADLLYLTEETTKESLEASLRDELERVKEREIQQGQTLAGPHRDDPVFVVDGRQLRLYGSQGQQRSFILAFKTAQIMDLEKTVGESPVLLLDDMTSELDKYRQGFFFHFLLARKGQVFITTTDISQLRSEGFGHARFFRVCEGSLREEA